MVRTPCYDQNGMKKGAWSKEEDELLRTYIQKYGHWNWRELPRFAGLSRCGKSCRLRWMNYLKPNVIRGNYTLEEDEMILKLYKEFGTKWCVIASRLPGRTDNDIKNHWHTTLKKRVTSATTPSAETKQTKEQFKCPSDKTEGKQNQPAGSSVILDCTTFAEEEMLESTLVSQGSSVNEFPTSVSSTSTADCLENTTPTSVLGYPFESAYEDLWTDPFLLDNIYFQQGYTPIWAEGENFKSPFDEMY